MNFRAFQTKATWALKMVQSVLLNTPMGTSKLVGSALGFFRS